MNNKILIGSIIAVSLLIGVSFTSVVGYNSVESDVKISPLFNIRSSRAIDEENKDIVCDYVGKGEETMIQFTSSNSRNKRLQEVIDVIGRMDDKTFKSYLNLIINQIRNNDKYDEVNINEVITTIQQIRDNPQTIILDESKIDNIETIGYDFTPTICWFPGCIFVGILQYILFIMIFSLFIILYYLYYGSLPQTTNPEYCS